MRSIANGLGIVVAEALWPELVGAATFDEMKAPAGEVAPKPATAASTSTEIASSTKDRPGNWRQFIGDDELPRYTARVAEWAPADPCHVL
jgi:hypothetical protein